MEGDEPRPSGPHRTLTRHLSCVRHRSGGSKGRHMPSHAVTCRYMPLQIERLKGRLAAASSATQSGVTALSEEAATKRDAMERAAEELERERAALQVWASLFSEVHVTVCNGM